MSRSRLDTITECPACGNVDIDESVSGFDGVCGACGFVIHDETDPTPPDWQLAENNSGETQRDDWLTVCQVRDATEKQIAQAFAAIEDIARILDLPTELRQDSADLYCEAFRSKTTDGRDTTSFVAACVRLASLQSEKPIPTSRLMEIEDAESKKFRLSYDALREELELNPPTPTPEDYIWFLNKALDLDESEITGTDQSFGAVTGDDSLVGKDPKGIAAAVVYLTGEDYTQAAVAEAVGVSTETIRLRANQLQELLSND